MLEPIDPIESFRPNPEARCVCGKAKLFKECCGSVSSDRQPPAGVILKKRFLPDELCDRLIAYVAKQGEVSDLATYVDNADKDKDPSAIKPIVTKDRVTSRVELSDKQLTIDKWVANIFHKVVAKQIKKKIRSYTPPDLMRYSAGGYYKPHADSELFDPSVGVWKKVLDRDFSLLLYLNNDYEGGALHFTYFNYTYQPTKGDLLVFPSDHLYLHEAQMVKSGLRYVIVSWANTK